MKNQRLNNENTNRTETNPCYRSPFQFVLVRCDFPIILSSYFQHCIIPDYYVIGRSIVKLLSLVSLYAAFVVLVILIL